MFTIGYLTAFFALGLLFLAIFMAILDLIIEGTLRDTFSYMMKANGVFILGAFAYSVRMVDVKIKNQIDSIDIDENERTIRFNLSRDLFESEMPVTLSIDDPLFKYNSNSNSVIKAVLLSFFPVGNISDKYPMDFYIRFVCLEKPHSMRYDEIFLQANCGWTKEQLEEILAELGRFKEEEDYYYGPKPKKRKKEPIDTSIDQ
jgi:hypothetical protein